MIVLCVGDRMSTELQFLRVAMRPNGTAVVSTIESSQTPLFFGDAVGAATYAVSRFAGAVVEDLRPQVEQLVQGWGYGFWKTRPRGFAPAFASGMAPAREASRPHLHHCYSGDRRRHQALVREILRRTA